MKYCKEIEKRKTKWQNREFKFAKNELLKKISNFVLLFCFFISFPHALFSTQNLSLSYSISHRVRARINGLDNAYDVKGKEIKQGKSKAMMIIETRPRAGTKDKSDYLGLRIIDMEKKQLFYIIFLTIQPKHFPYFPIFRCFAFARMLQHNHKNNRQNINQHFSSTKSNKNQQQQNLIFLRVSSTVNNCNCCVFDVIALLLQPEDARPHLRL